MKNFVEKQHYNKDLFDFLRRCPTAFHVISEIKERLLNAGFKELDETEKWEINGNSKYFVVRENSALAAFTLASDKNFTKGFRMVASHSDSPGLQLKPIAAVNSHPYLQLGVEIYGGPLLHQWFDRDLSLAGRVCVTDAQNSLQEYLIDFQRPLLSIPSVAIHLDREANAGKNIDKQKMLPPILAQSFSDQLPEFNSIIIERIKEQYEGSNPIELLSFDLFCYDPQPPALLGLNREFISGARLDNQLSCHAATVAMQNVENISNNLFICTNHEENGSTSTTGAQSSFSLSILERLLPDHEERHICLRNSLLVSADNAHAVHPNYKEKSDPAHEVHLNSGIVVKVNANQRYASNSRTISKFKLLAKAAEIPTQEFVMRTDMPCGSTVGPMTAAKLGVETVDIGVPTFGMHSIRELTGSQDPLMLYRIIMQFLR